MKCWIGLFVVITCFVSNVMASPTVDIRGEWEQGGILFGQVEAGSTVTIDGVKLKITPKGRFVFGLGRSAKKESSVVITSPNGVSQTQKYSVKQRDYKVQRVEGVKKEHVTPPKEVLDRISKEIKQVKKARSLNDLREDFLADFQWPLTGPITGVYGSQRVYNGVPKSPHYGIDIAGPVGAIVHAPAAGVITLAESDLYYSGGTIILDHGYGLSSSFLHLSKVLVKAGQVIEQGQIIAEVGATGRATGPHLDWRMNWFKVRVDPGLLMKGKPM